MDRLLDEDRELRAKIEAAEAERAARPPSPPYNPYTDGQAATFNELRIPFTVQPDIGAIYGVRPPTNPPYRAPGQWNTFRIDFQAPRFDGAGKKIASAKFIKVELNGKVIHENVEVPAPTRSALTGKERPAGPLMLQGDHGPVAYRNLRITPRD